MTIASHDGQAAGGTEEAVGGPESDLALVLADRTAPAPVGARGRPRPPVADPWAVLDRYRRYALFGDVTAGAVAAALAYVWRFQGHQRCPTSC